MLDISRNISILAAKLRPLNTHRDLFSIDHATAETASSFSNCACSLSLSLSLSFWQHTHTHTHSHNHTLRLQNKTRVRKNNKLSGSTKMMMMRQLIIELSSFSFVFEGNNGAEKACLLACCRIRRRRTVMRLIN